MADVEIVEYNGMRARVLERSDGRYKVYWREARREKSTTLTLKKDAMKKAEKVVRHLASSQGGRLLTADDAELAALVKKHAGTRSPFVWVNEAADAEKRLKGVATLSQAARHFEESGMIVERVKLATARIRFLGGYDDSPPDTSASMRKVINALHTRFSGADLLDLTPEMIEAFCAAKRKGKVAPKTFNNRLGYVRTFLNCCRDWKMLPDKIDHAADLVKRRKEPDRIPEIFTPEVAAAALMVLPEYLVPTFVVGNWMGLRPRAELRQVEWEHFDWSPGGHLHVTLAVARKTMRERFPPIPDNVRVLLKRWRHAKGKVSGRGHIEKISKILRKDGIIKRWPADVMRHSYISYQLAAGHGIGQVAEWAGTSEKKIRKNYRRPLRKQDAKKWSAIRTAAYLPVVFLGPTGRPRKA